MNTHCPSYLKLIRPRSRGFTVVELLAVIFVAGIILAISFPVIAAMQSSSRAKAGVNTASVAIDVSRAWSTFGISPVDTTTSTAGGQTGSYSGTAALFTPGREIRILVENLDAANAADQLDPVWLGGDGYEDKPGLDYVAVPSGVGYVGVRRVGGNLQFLAPPFAIAFSAEGQLLLEKAQIYYDANFDGTYNTGSTRGGTYNPSAWERDGASEVIDGTTTKRHLPFETIETVSSVISFDLNDFYDQFGRGDWQTDDNNAAGEARRDWIKNNGQVLLFSPLTGITFRDEAR